jgi:hypothetical protein
VLENDGLLGVPHADNTARVPRVSAPPCVSRQFSWEPAVKYFWLTSAKDSPGLDSFRSYVNVVLDSAASVETAVWLEHDVGAVAYGMLLHPVLAPTVNALPGSQYDLMRYGLYVPVQDAGALHVPSTLLVVAPHAVVV